MQSSSAWRFGAINWLWVMVGVLLLTWAFNTYQLGSESIWTDEGLTYTFASGPTTNILPLYSQLDDYHPPLQYLAWHYWMELVGRSEFALRALAALIGLTTVALVYQIGRTLFARPTNLAIGVLAGLLVATSGFQVYYSQTIRAYCLLELFGLWSALACFQLTRRFSFRNMLAYELVSVALLYTHLYSFFVLLGQNLFIAIWLFSTWRKNRAFPAGRALGAWVFLQLTLAAAFLGWLPELLYQLQYFKTLIAAQPALGLLIGTFLEFTWSVPAFATIVCLLILSAYIGARRKLTVSPSANFTAPTRPDALGIGFLLTSLLGLYAIPVAISLAFKPIFLPRYAISVLPAFYLIVVWVAFTQLRRLVAGLLLAAIFIFQLLGLQSLYLAPNNENWRAAAVYLDGAAQSGETVLFFPGLSRGAFDYYATLTDLAEISLPPGDGPAETEAQLANRPATVWLALAYVDTTPFEAVLDQQGYTKTQQESFFRLNILEYQKASP